MNPGPGDLDLGHAGKRLQFRRDQPGQRARVGPGPLGQHHRRIGRKVAVRSVARRLDRHRLARQPGGQRALGFKGIEHSVEERGISGIKGHGRASSAATAARHDSPAPQPLEIAPRGGQRASRS